MANRTVEYLKQRTPNNVRVAARRAMLDAHNVRLRLTTPVVDRCGYDNIYHCAMQKTASQWIKALFSDPIVYRHSGLLPYVPRYYKWRQPAPFPRGRAVVSLFAPYKNFRKVPKPDRYAAFFVLRDPRDIVISSYFSTRDTHAPMGDVLQVRAVLREKPFKEGLIHLIGHLARKGSFAGIRAWATAPAEENIRVFRYEDLTGADQSAEIDRMMRHCGIVIPPAELTTLLDRYSFTRMRGAPARPGSTSHYRKGKAGDWRNHFDDEVYAAFTAAAGDLVELLGYPARDQAPPADRQPG